MPKWLYVLRNREHNIFSMNTTLFFLLLQSNTNYDEIEFLTKRASNEMYKNNQNIYYNLQ